MFITTIKGIDASFTPLPAEFIKSAIFYSSDKYLIKIFHTFRKLIRKLYLETASFFQNCSDIAFLSDDIIGNLYLNDINKL